MAGCSLIAEAVRDDGGNYRGTFYSNGVIFCACGGNGLRAYTFNGTAFALLDTIDDGGTYYSVWVDGTTVYATCGLDGLRAYNWDGANFTLIDTDDQGGIYFGIWSDGTYIYVTSQNDALMAYSFNGVALTYIDTYNAGVNVQYWYLVGDGNYIYVASYNAGVGGNALWAFGFNGATFNMINTISDIPANNYVDVCMFGDFIIAGHSGAGLRAYRFNGAVFTLIATIDDGDSYATVATDGYYIYTSILRVAGDYLRAYSFDGAAFTLEYQVATEDVMAAQNKMSIGDFIYFPAWGDGIRAFTALFADFSINDNALFGNQVAYLTAHCGLPQAMGLWDYDFGDGTTAAVKNPTKSYGTPGTYTITLALTRAGLTETHSIVVGVGGISATPENGNSPLDVQFSYVAPSTGADAVSWIWNFGDGETSTEQNPQHRFSMAGEYVVTVRATDANGRSGIATIIIYIYDSDLLNAEGGVHIPYSDVCFRHAVKASQGVGLVPWGGTYWIWPEVYVGTAKGFNAANEPVSVVFNNSTGQFFRLGIPDLWQDRVGPYAAYDIPTRIRFRELISRGGEMEQIIHREHHAHLRPYYEDNRSVAGFNRDGFPENFGITGRLFFDGEPTTPGAILQRIPRLADYAFRQHRRVRRVQFELETNKSGYKGVGTQANIEELDKKPPPPENRKAETAWQMEFRTPDIWVSRNSTEPTQNRATGLELTGAYDILTTGPDGRGGTAMAFAPAQGLNVTLDFTANNFTILVWLAQMATYPGTIWQFTTSTGGTLLIQILDIGGELYARFNDGVNLFTQLLSWNGLSWMLLAVQKEGNVIRFIENNALLGNHNMIDNTIGYGGASMLINGATVSIADARRVPRAVSLPAIQDYHRAVTEQEGRGYLPVMR
jgi:PKD repeat protein